jgi:hypothetical protein
MHARTCDFSCCLESGDGSILEFQRLIPGKAWDPGLGFIFVSSSCRKTERKQSPRSVGLLCVW